MPLQKRSKDTQTGRRGGGRLKTEAKKKNIKKKTANKILRKSSKRKRI